MLNKALSLTRILAINTGNVSHRHPDVYGQIIRQRHSKALRDYLKHTDAPFWHLRSRQHNVQAIQEKGE